jgi:outer membrane cobalamin receptor
MPQKLGFLIKTLFSKIYLEGFGPKGKTMKKILSVLLCLTFTTSLAFSQEAFLSLTKYGESLDKLPSNVTIITQEDIENKHVETLGELLEHETSINYRTYGTLGAASSISIRGASALQTLVLIDGRRVNDIGLGSADFTSIPIANIERVEVIRGAGSSIYGTSAFGGVVNVMTKKAAQDSPVLKTDISYGSFNTLQAGMVGAYANERTGALVASSMISSDGDRNNSAFNSQNVLFNASVKATENSDISLSANIYEGVYGAPGSKSFPSDNAEQKDSNNETTRT